MRKLKLQVQVSVDGYIAGPNNEMDWLVWNWDNELKHYVNKITEPVDTILLGRKLAEGFINAWAARVNDPKTADHFAHKMNDTPKIVFSKTLDKVEWKNTTLAKGDLVDEITKLKKEDGKDIIAYGGAAFVSDLIKNKLIDDLYLFVNPTALGDGMSIFKKLDNRQDFNLAESRAFDCGIVVMHYQPK